MSDSVLKDLDGKRAQLSSNGYVIVRNVVPPEILAQLRRDIDAIVAREREADPNWDTTNQPRGSIGDRVDEQTIGAFEFILHENTYGLSARLLECPKSMVAYTIAQVLANPEFTPGDPERPGQEWGTDPRNWHRDFRPDTDGPLSAVLEDQKANGIAYIQWNIALYRDHILYIVPGSHRRLNSKIESSHLSQQRGTLTPLPESLRVELEPGDGVVYNSIILHWGSKYTHREKRRTIQLGYRSFGRILPTQRAYNLPMRAWEKFADGSSQRLIVERWSALFGNEFATIESIFRAALTGDRTQFDRGLSQLHPAEEGRLATLILLSKIVLTIQSIRDNQVNGAPGPDDPKNEYEWRLRELSDRFNDDDLERLRQRFDPVDKALKTSSSAHVSGFLGPTTEYEFEKMPPAMSAEGTCDAIIESDPS